ncbi:hypothetical protein BF93_05820 [Brachybacterium phenoliresistens]|uniref:Zinc ribbon domain-containing protein n=1 Tax=Brachybacterium phenoliresistens TaxID=396014 RepID=Z9JWL9_9MICO|nr:DUF6320 domain-containing protein [Brachybacterium phenoliresistens]EWS82554.1 hypothetical protein BF93_05820 [Brachybacterium phenoliresistens]
MRRCPDCGVAVEGAWSRCPLCGRTVMGPMRPDPFPAVPLRFSRRRIYRILLLASLVVILASFGAQMLFDRGHAGIGLVRSVWLGLSAMWLVVLMAVRARRDIAKGTATVVVLICGICAYWDYLVGWDGWSLTYAVPIVCGCSILALVIAVPALRIEAGDHVLYSGTMVLLGLVPIVFTALGWVADPIPSVCCGALAVIVLVMQERDRVSDVLHELGKRLHI